MSKDKLGLNVLKGMILGKLGQFIQKRGGHVCIMSHTYEGCVEDENYMTLRTENGDYDLYYDSTRIGIGISGSIECNIFNLVFSDISEEYSEYDNGRLVALISSWIYEYLSMNYSLEYIELQGDEKYIPEDKADEVECNSLAKEDEVSENEFIKYISDRNKYVDSRIPKELFDKLDNYNNLNDDEIREVADEIGRLTHQYEEEFDKLNNKNN